MPSSTLQKRLQQGGLNIDSIKSTGGQPRILPSGEQQSSKSATQEFSLARTIGNIPRSAGEFGSSMFEAIRHPVQSIMNIGQISAGGIQSIPGIKEFYDERSTNKVILEENRQKFELVKDFFVERYGSGEKALNTLENDPVGFALDLSVVFSGVGGVLRGAGTVTKVAPITKAGQVSSKIGQITEPITGTIKAGKALLTKPKGGIVGGAQFLTKGSLGITTGAGPEAIRVAIKASPTRDFVTALRNNFVRDDLVQAARASFENMKNRRSAEYTAELAKIEKIEETLDLTPIRKFTTEKLKNFRVKIDAGGSLDFTGSPISKTASQKEVRGMMKDVLNWKDNTPAGIDILKRRLDDFYTDSSQGRALVNSVKNEVRSLLNEKVPGYSNMTKKYAQASKDLQEIEKTMSLGTKSSMDSALKKLTSSLKENQDLRGELLDMLNQASKSDLEGMVAGAVLNPIIPSGLIGRGIFASGPLAVLAGVATLNPKILVPMLVASPRVVGEFLLALGYARGCCIIISSCPGTIDISVIVDNTSAFSDTFVCSPNRLL